MNGPLTGIRVIEVGHMLMGPYCGMMLADLGAEVIKVEPPEGDIGRRVSPHLIGSHNAYFASLNRSKKSVVLDLNSDDGQAALAELARTSQGLITNLRPSAIRKLKLTYESLSRHNPDIVCVAMTGYGLESPFAGRPAYDYVIQAFTGIMMITGDPDGPPAKTGYSAVDNSAGLMGAIGLLAKLIERKGGQVDIAMYDVMLSQLNYIAGAWLNAEEEPQRWPRSAHPYVVPAQIFETADGWITLFVTHDEFWRRFAEQVGRADWVTDPRFATMTARRENREDILREISQVLISRPTAEWTDQLLPLGVVAAGVETLQEALMSDHTEAREMVIAIDTLEGPIRAVGNPIRISGAVNYYTSPPLLNEHAAMINTKAVKR